MANSVRLFGKTYLEMVADIPPPKNSPRVISPEDLSKEMNKNPVSMAYVKGLLRKLVSVLQKYGAEFVSSDGDNFISIINEDREIMIAPVVKEREISISVERLSYDGKLRVMGTIPLDESTTYNGVSAQIAKLVSRASAQNV